MVKSAREDKLILPLNAAASFASLCSELCSIKCCGQCKDPHVYMDYDFGGVAWNLHKMITAGKYLAIYHFGNWSGDLVGWASGFVCKLSTVLQQKLFTSKHWACISSLHCSSQSTCRVKATMLHEGGWPKLIAAFFHHPSCNVQCCQQINIPKHCVCLLASFLRQNRF